MPQSNVHFTTLKPHHAAIAPYLRQADLDEIALTTDLTPGQAVAMSIALSSRGFAAYLSNKLCAVFGISWNTKHAGTIWLVGTDGISRHPVTFYRESRRIFPKLTHGFDYLSNFVDARNELSLRWLHWLGFTIEGERYGLHLVHWHRKEQT